MNIVSKKYRLFYIFILLFSILIIASFLLFWLNLGNAPLKIKLAEDTRSATSTVPQSENKDVRDTITTPEDTPISNEPLFQYLEVIDGCDFDFLGECLLVHSGPGTEYPVVARLRNDIVLRTESSVENAGITWYKIIFDEKLVYPERVNGDWYVSGEYIQTFGDAGDITIWDKGRVLGTTTKIIVVNRTEQKLYAYDGDTLFMETSISTGLPNTPTPLGSFTVFKMTPSRYMQGPFPKGVSDQYYDLPGVPWNLYFTDVGDVIHGTYWHNSFGSTYSHGCVNLLPKDSKKLYDWAELGTKVIVKD